MSRLCVYRLICCIVIILFMSFLDDVVVQPVSASDAPQNPDRAARRSLGAMSLDQIREALKTDKKNDLLYYRAGFLEEKRGNYEQAIKDYGQVVKLKSRQTAQAYLRMGICWESMGEFYDLQGKFTSTRGRVVNGPHLRKAIGLYQEAIKENVRFAEAYYRLSLAHLIQNDLNSAQKAYQELQKLEPEAERTHQLLMAIYKHHQENKR